MHYLASSESATCAGLADNHGLIIAILFGVASLAVGVIGGIVWVAGGYQRRSVRNIDTITLAHAALS
jgi:hypothetical protein